MERQFTATAYIIVEEKILLLWHLKFQKWMPPGGHLEANELPHEGAIRETFEETGWEVEIIGDKYRVETKQAASIPPPFSILLEKIPAIGDKPAHEHIDMLFLAHAIRKTGLGESHLEKRWFSADEVEALESDVEIFSEMKQIILDLLPEREKSVR